MKVQLKKGNELTQDDVDCWSRLQQADDTLDSPFFRPEYTQAVASQQDNVEVAILRQDDQTVGFFPFQRAGSAVAVPVGGTLSDFQAVVRDKDVTISPVSLLRRCGLRAWHFDHLLTSQQAFSRYHWQHSDSPYMDLSRGFVAYCDERKQAGSNSIRQAQRKARKIEREVGPLRLEPHTGDRQVFDRLIDWKLAQYRRIKSVNHLAEPWKIEFLKKITRTQTDQFSGILSALYAGDYLVAAHLGMISGGVLHCWFPSYDESFAKYSPGLVFWVQLAEQCEALGIRRIDLGKGNERYKQSLQNGKTLLAEGSVDMRPVTRSVRRLWRGTRQWVRNSPFRVPAKKLVQSIRAIASFGATKGVRTPSS